MGYKISYENGGGKTVVSNKPKQITSGWRVFALLVLVVVAIALICQTDNIRYWLLPGNGKATEAAFKNFIQTVRDGTEIREAVTTFCREVIECAG